MSQEVSKNQARHIIHRLGETGQPPERGALSVNVATGDLLEILRQEYLLPMKELGRNSSFKLVQAPFGGGKTHFLHCLREIAWQDGFVTALVGVSPQECPFDDPVRIYQAVARHLECPPQSSDVEPEPGLEIVLRQICDTRVQAHGAESFRTWMHEEFVRFRVESTAVRRATRLYLEAVLDRDLDAQDQLAAYLRGEPLRGSERHELQLREELEPATAFRFLRSVVQVLRALQVPGLVLLFDELDRVMSLSVKRRKSIGDNLRQMIDHCGQSTLPSLLWCYAVPPEFMTNVVPEYPALEQRLKGAARFSTHSPLQPIIDLDHLSISPSELFLKIGCKLIELYERGFEHTFDRKIQQKNMELLAVELGESQLESGTRRTFVKAAVTMISDQQRAEERLLTADEIRHLASQADMESPPPMEDEEEIF